MRQSTLTDETRAILAAALEGYQFSPTEPEDFDDGAAVLWAALCQGAEEQGTPLVFDEDELRVYLVEIAAGDGWLILPWGVVGRLTTDHPASSRGLPVLVLPDGEAYGPGDLLERPDGSLVTALAAVQTSGHEWEARRVGALDELVDRLAEDLRDCAVKCTWDDLVQQARASRIRLVRVPLDGIGRAEWYADTIRVSTEVSDEQALKLALAILGAMGKAQ